MREIVKVSLFVTILTFFVKFGHADESFNPDKEGFDFFGCVKHEFECRELAEDYRQSLYAVVNVYEFCLSDRGLSECWAKSVY